MKTSSSPSLKRRLAIGALALPLIAGSTFAFAQGAPGGAPPAPRPATVAELRDMNDLRLEGRVAEIFGGRFVLEDATGRTLVDLGPRGGRGDLVKTGDTVSVDGRFERGAVEARSISVGGGRVALERPRPEREGPRGPGRRPGPDGPRHGQGDEERDGPPPPHERRAERGWFSGGVDEEAAAKALTDAGYTQVTLVDTKRRHAEFTATDASGKAWDLKVDEDNAIREREPFTPPLAEEAARGAIERLGYTFEGGFEVKKDHVEADARDASGREVRVEMNADGSLRKERFGG